MSQHIEVTERDKQLQSALC